MKNIKAFDRTNIKLMQETVERRIHDGSLRQALEKRRPATKTINSVVDRALCGKPLHGLVLVESGNLRQSLSHNYWTEDEINYLINRGTESPFIKAVKRSIAGVEK